MVWRWPEFPLNALLLGGLGRIQPAQLVQSLVFQVFPSFLKGKLTGRMMYELYLATSSYPSQLPFPGRCCGALETKLRASVWKTHHHGRWVFYLPCYSLLYSLDFKLALNSWNVFSSCWADYFNLSFGCRISSSLLGKPTNIIPQPAMEAYDPESKRNTNLRILWPSHSHCPPLLPCPSSYPRLQSLKS